MRSQTRWLPLGLAGILALVNLSSPLAAQGTRGDAPRGGTAASNTNRGNNGRGARGDGSAAQTNAQARKQIQDRRKAAIDSANAMFKLTMLSARQDGPAAAAEIKLAQDQRKRAIEKANADAKSALAALQASQQGSK